MPIDALNKDEEIREMLAWSDPSLIDQPPMVFVKDEPVQFVGQRQYGIYSSSYGYRYGGTAGMFPCVGLVVFSETLPAERRMFIAHIDGMTDFDPVLKKYLQSAPASRIFLVGRRCYYQTVKKLKHSLEPCRVKLHMLVYGEKAPVSFIADVRTGAITFDVNIGQFWMEDKLPTPIDGDPFMPAHNPSAQPLMDFVIDHK